MRLLLVLLAVSASAAEAPGPCVKKLKRSYEEPATLGALLSCQKKKLAEAVAAYRAKNGTDAPESTSEQWQERQAGETHDYLNRHPDRVPAAKTTAKAAESSKPEDSAALKRELLEMSGDGKNGVTPEMAQKVNDYLMKNQGSVSPDMQSLLKSVQKDGGDLTNDTVNQLKDASQKARGAGLDLETDKKTEEFLLSPKEPTPGTN